MDNFVSLLKNIGVGQEEITKFVAGELPEQEVVNIVVNNQKTLHQNDKEFRDSLKKGISDDLTTKMNKHFRKQFGFAPEEMQGKDFEELFELGRMKIVSEATKQYENTSNEKYIKDIEHYKKTISDIQAEKERLEKEVIPSVEAKALDKINQYRIDLSLERYIADIGVTTSVMSAYRSFKGHLEDNDLKVILDGNNLKLLTTEGSPYMSNNKIVELKDFAQSFFKSENILKQSNATVTPEVNGTKSVKLNQGDSTTIQSVANNPMRQNTAGLQGLHKAEANLKK